MNAIFDATKRQLEAISYKSEIFCLIFAHRQADPDALCSAGAIKLLLQNSLNFCGENIRLVAPDGASVLGKQVSTTLGINFEETIDDALIQKADLIIVVDTGDRKLLEPYADSIKQSRAKKIVIDHHSSSELEETWVGVDEKIVTKGSDFDVRNSDSRFSS